MKLAIFMGLAGLALFGVWESRLLEQRIWAEGAFARFIWFAGGYAAAALLFRKWLLPSTMAAAVMWAVLMVGWLPVFAAIYFLASCYALGRRIWKDAGPVHSMLGGAALWTFVIGIAVRFPINLPWVYWAVLGLPLIRRWRFHPNPKLPLPGVPHLLLIFALLTHWLTVVHPEASADGLAMHLAAPAELANEGRFAIDLERHAWAVMPMAGDWAYTAVFLLGGEFAARILNFAWLVAIAMLIVQAARKWVDEDTAALAAALFVSTPLVQLVTGSMFVENFWAAMVLGALTSGGTLAGALLGAGAAAKIGAVAFLPLLFRERDWRTWAAFLALAAPPYVTSWWLTGNPVYPSFEPAIGHDARFPGRLSWRSLYDATFDSGRFMEATGGAAGLQWLLLLPLALCWWRRWWLWIGVAAAIGTFAVQPNLRYLYAAFAVLSIAIAWVIEDRRFRWAALAIFMLNLCLLPASGWQHKDLFRPPPDPVRELTAHLNRTAPGDSVLMLGTTAIAGLKAHAYTDSWHTAGFQSRLRACSTQDRVAGLLSEMKIRWLIAPKDTRPPTPALHRFVSLCSTPVRAAGSFELRRPAECPPAFSEPLRAGAYEDYHPAIEYQGAWLHDSQFSETTGASVTYSGIAGDLFRVRFEGRAITWVHTRASNRGRALVIIDGVERQELNLFSPHTRWRERITFGALTPGVHVLEIRIRSGFADIDQLVIE